MKLGLLSVIVSTVLAVSLTFSYFVPFIYLSEPFIHTTFVLSYLSWVLTFMLAFNKFESTETSKKIVRKSKIG